MFANAAQKEKTMKNFLNIVKDGKTKGGCLVSFLETFPDSSVRFCDSGSYVAWMNINCQKSCTCRGKV